MPATRLTILHVVAPAPFGGLESVLRALASGHMARGHSVHVAAVISPGTEPHPFVDTLTSDGVATETIRVGDRDYRGERHSVRALCRGLNPDVVHTHGYRCDVADGGVARDEGIAVVSTCHGFIESDWKGRLSQWLQRRMLRRYDAVIAVSSPIANRLRDAGVPDDRIHLVPNGFSADGHPVSRDEARTRLNIPPGPAIGWVGRLSHEKGPDVALQALSQMENQAARLVMIGDGRERDALRARASALGLDERVIWCGAIPKAGSLLSAFDAFLLSSRTEGTPMALLEAMSAGVPIVATRVGGVPDVVDDRSARLVASEDVTALSRALTSVLADRAAAASMTSAARAALAAKFALDPWLDRHEAIYRAIAAERRKILGN